MRLGMIFRMPKEPKKAVRMRVRIAVCIFFGLLISLLTAFVPAVFGNVAYVGFESSTFYIECKNPPRYLGDLIPEFRAAVWCAPNEPRYGWQNWLDSSISYEVYYYGEPFIEWDRTVHGDIPPYFSIRRGSFGFPFKCMYADELGVANGAGSYTLTFFDNCKARSGLRLGVPISGLKSPMVDRILPMTFHWGGLSLNVLIYSGVCGLFFVLPTVIRRMCRDRDGLCAECGYKIEELLVCPECGRAACLAVD